jgi:hypothetical protein
MHTRDAELAYEISCTEDARRTPIDVPTKLWMNMCNAGSKDIATHGSGFITPQDGTDDSTQSVHGHAIYVYVWTYIWLYIHILNIQIYIAVLS